MGLLNHSYNDFYCLQKSNAFPYGPNKGVAGEDGENVQVLGMRPPLKPLEEVTCFKVRLKNLNITDM